MDPQKWGSRPLWARYGKVHKALLDDPKMRAVLQEAGQIATRESYVSQTIPDI
jgi:hypothetical protein